MRAIGHANPIDACIWEVTLVKGHEIFQSPGNHHWVN